MILSSPGIHGFTHFLPWALGYPVGQPGCSVNSTLTELLMGRRGLGPPYPSRCLRTPWARSLGVLHPSGLLWRVVEVVSPPPPPPGHKQGFVQHYRSLFSSRPNVLNIAGTSGPLDLAVTRLLLCQAGLRGKESAPGVGRCQPPLGVGGTRSNLYRHNGNAGRGDSTSRGRSRLVPPFRQGVLGHPLAFPG